MIKQIRTVCCTLVFLGLQLLACSHADLVVFGDSLSDAGNFSVATGGALPPPTLYFHGQFSDGPVWTEPLATALDEPTPLPSLIGGTNYAFNGARAAQLNSLRSELRRARIADVQISRLFQAITRYPRLFGLRNVVDSATLFDPVTGLGYALAPNVDPSRYLFWDSVHPTTKGHKIIAAYAFIDIEIHCRRR